MFSFDWGRLGHYLFNLLWMDLVRMEKPHWHKNHSLWAVHALAHLLSVKNHRRLKISQESFIVFAKSTAWCYFRILLCEWPTARLPFRTHTPKVQISTLTWTVRYTLPWEVFWLLIIERGELFAAWWAATSRMICTFVRHFFKMADESAWQIKITDESAWQKNLSKCSVLLQFGRVVYMEI